MADAVVIPVIDENGIKHYAYLPDDPSHPMYHGKPTYCNRDASFFEIAQPLEELYQMVQAFIGSSMQVASQLKIERNKKAAAFLSEGMARMARQIKDVLNYHKDMCRKCVEELNNRADN